MILFDLVNQSYNITSSRCEFLINEFYSLDAHKKVR